MSTDTTVVLVHGPRLVRCTVPILVGLLAFAAPLVGQARHGHFYHVNYYQVRPGQEKAYDSALVDVVTPVFDELVKRKAVVSYLLLTKIAGAGENTHLVIVEVATPSAEGTFQRELRQPRRLCSTSLGATQPCASRSCVDSCTPSCTRPLANGPNAGITRGDRIGGCRRANCELAEAGRLIFTPLMQKRNRMAEARSSLRSRCEY